MAINGSDIVLMVNVSGTMTAVGSQRDVTFEETTEEIDVSSKDGRSKRVLPGRYSSSVSLDGLYVPSDDAYLALQTAMRNGTAVVIAKDDDEYASAIITSLSEAFPDQDGATISASLTISGAWTAGTGPGA